MSTLQAEKDARYTKLGSTVRGIRVSSVQSENKSVEGNTGYAYNDPPSFRSIESLSDEWLISALRAPLVAGGIEQNYAVEDLMQLGIKVRDFAYESTLPPISSIPQFVGRARNLKRERSMLESADEFVASSGSANIVTRSDPSSGISKKAKGLTRELTEPVDLQTSPQQSSLVRHPRFFESGGSVSAFPDRNRYPLSQPITPQLQRHIITTSPLKRTSLAIPDWRSPSQRDVASQESDAWIDTPIITPDGLLQWKVTDTSAIPASQLDTEFQQPTTEDATLSQLCFTADSSQQPLQNVRDHTPDPPSVASSSRRAARPFTPPLTRSSAASEVPPLSLLESPIATYVLRDRATPSTLDSSTGTPRSLSHKCTTSRSPGRASPRLRPARLKEKGASQSLQPLRRSARNAHKVGDAGIVLSR